LLVYSSLGDRKGMMELAEAASKCSYTMGRSRRP
jgi:hypothetical protein